MILGAIFLGWLAGLGAFFVGLVAFGLGFLASLGLFASVGPLCVVAFAALPLLREGLSGRAAPTGQPARAARPIVPHYAQTPRELPR